MQFKLKWVFVLQIIQTSAGIFILLVELCVIDTI
jgi:hypothetical protein